MNSDIVYTHEPNEVPMMQVATWIGCKLVRIHRTTNPVLVLMLNEIATAHGVTPIGPNAWASANILRRQHEETQS